MIEQVIFLQGDQADEVLELFETHGVETAIECLSQYHFPGEHQTSNELGAGTMDDVYHGEVPETEGYVLTVNESLNYIGLEYSESLKPVQY